MTTYALRVRDDATGPVARWAGQIAGTSTDREQIAAIKAATPNGVHMDLIEVEDA